MANGYYVAVRPGVYSGRIYMAGETIPPEAILSSRVHALESAGKISWIQGEYLTQEQVEHAIVGNCVFTDQTRVLINILTSTVGDAVALLPTLTDPEAIELLYEIETRATVRKALDDVFNPVIGTVTTSVTVSATWNDADDLDSKRPASLTVSLYENGVDSTRTLTLDEAGGWTATLTELDEYIAGEPVVYTIGEVTVADYTATISGDEATSFVIALDQAVTVAGNKTWSDNDDAALARPASITINLKADGVEADTAVVSATESWAWSFADLPKYASGIPIVYTIEEAAVADYTASVVGFNVTNTYSPA